MRNHRTLSSRSVRSGFTLIELLLVLVILAVLAALIVPKFTGRSQQAREQAAKTDITTISGAIGRFEVDTGRYPTSEEGLNALMAAPSDTQSWRGPYLEKLPNDPWGKPYVYASPGSGTAGYDVISLGSDGRESQDDIKN